jgi:hypothetical protein
VSDRMARNAPRVPRPRRSRRTRETAAAPTGRAGAPDPHPAANPSASLPDDAATVYGWLTRLTTDPAETERLLIEIVRLARTSPPACVRAASDHTRLQFLTVRSVLRQRGVL